jgi:hypothetical protein
MEPCRQNCYQKQYLKTEPLLCVCFVLSWKRSDIENELLVVMVIA